MPLLDRLRRARRRMVGTNDIDTSPLPVTPVRSARSVGTTPKPALPRPPRAAEVQAPAGFAAAVQAVDLQAPPASAPVPQEEDNESTRAAEAGLRLGIDRNLCIGCGTCVENAETVFYLDDSTAKAYVLAQRGPMDRVQDAIDACPVACIAWDDRGETERPPDHR